MYPYTGKKIIYIEPVRERGWIETLIFKRKIIIIIITISLVTVTIATHVSHGNPRQRLYTKTETTELQIDIQGGVGGGCCVRSIQFVTEKIGGTIHFCLFFDFSVF